MTDLQVVIFMLFSMLSRHYHKNRKVDSVYGIFILNVRKSSAHVVLNYIVSPFDVGYRRTAFLKFHGKLHELEIGIFHAVEVD